MVGRPRKDSSNLSVDKIVEAAWAVVDRDGVSKLSTRALAAELGVQSPALYWHVKNKQHLLGLMVEHVLGDPMAHVPEDAHWSDWLRSIVREQRRALLSHRDSGQILSISPPTERLRTFVFPELIKPLMRAGLPRDLAQAAGGACASYLLGWIIYEQRAETRGMIEAIHDPDTGFDYGLELIIQGIAAMAQPETQQASPNGATQDA